MRPTHRLTPPLKWHGGKHYLAERIIAIMPAHTHYVEPYFGGGAVLLANPFGVSEVVNDLHGELTNFCASGKTRTHSENSSGLWRPCRFRAEWERACESLGTAPVQNKRSHSSVRCRQSRAGQMRDFATLSRTRTRRAMNEQASAWITAVEGLPEVAARLKRVVVLNDDALAVIQREDGPQTLFYCDPPYAHETRAFTDVYGFEKTGKLKLIPLALGLFKPTGDAKSGYRHDL